MNTITTTPCAKINLGLNIVERRKDGYHNLETVFLPVPIFDKITIRTNNSKDGSCILLADGTPIPGNPNQNLVVKAYKALCQKRMLPGVEIALTKNIPTQAGMGGGSADCAYTLTAINELFNARFNDTELTEIAAQLGADCPFFIKSKTCYATGIGEKLEYISNPLPGDCWIAIVKPPVSVSTKEAFAGITPRHPEICCREVVERHPMEEWKQLLHNDFEDTIFPLHPTLRAIKELLYASGAAYAAMSGSGSALFGIFHTMPDIDTYLPELKGCRIEKLRMKGAMEEVPIVDEEGNTIGKTTRSCAHGGMKPLHPVVHLHVFNSQGELYLQKRPDWKDIQPSKWDTAVGGHVDYGENIECALLRETHEELGIEDFSPKALSRYVFESDREKELVNVYQTTYDNPIHPSKEELCGGRFFTREEIMQNIGKEVFTPNFEKEWLRLFGGEKHKK